MKSRILLLLVFILFHFSCVTENILEEKDLTVSVKFPFSVNNVKMHLWSPSNQIIEMVESAESYYYSTRLNGYYEKILFNISYDIPQYDIFNYWLAAGNTYSGNIIPNRFDPHGIKYAEKIFINGQKIDNSYTVVNNTGDGLNISVKINQNNAIEPFYDKNNVNLPFNSAIPSEVHHRYAYCNKNLPQPNHIEVAGWIAALHTDAPLIESKIMVDYIFLYGRKNNDLTLLAKNEYNSFDPVNDGGLYLRYPFFPEGFDEHDPLFGAATDGILTLVPTASPNKVLHLWTPQYLNLSGFNYDSFRVECRLRIEGNAIVQAGIDFRDKNQKVSEFGVTDWCLENNGLWQIIVFDSKDF